MKNHRKEIVLSLCGFAAILFYILYSAKIETEPAQLSVVLAPKVTLANQKESPEPANENPFLGMITAPSVVPANPGSSISQRELWELFEKEFPEIAFQASYECPEGYTTTSPGDTYLSCMKKEKLSDGSFYEYSLSFTDGELQNYSKRLAYSINGEQRGKSVIDMSMYQGKIRYVHLITRIADVPCFNFSFYYDGEHENAIEQYYEYPNDYLAKPSPNNSKYTLPIIKKSILESKGKLERILNSLCTNYGDLRACSTHSTIVRKDCLYD